jgi:hypothetical protein
MVSKELSQLSNDGFDTSRIKSLTLIDIDTLIFHQDILKDRQIKLHEIFDLYHKHVFINENRKYDTREQAEEHVMRSLQNFGLFFSNLAIE